MSDLHDSTRPETAGEEEVALNTILVVARDNLAQTRRDYQRTKDQLEAAHRAELLQKEKGQASKVTEITVGYGNQLTKCTTELNKLTTTHNKLLQDYSTALSTLEAARERIKQLEELDKNSPSTITKLQKQIQDIQTASDIKLNNLDSELTSKFTATINSKDSTINAKDEQIKTLDLQVTQKGLDLERTVESLRRTQAAKTDLEERLQVVTNDRDNIQVERDGFESELKIERGSREFDCGQLRLEAIKQEKLRVVAEGENVKLTERFEAEKVELLAEKKRLKDEYEAEKSKWQKAIDIQEERHTVRLRELTNQSSIIEGDAQRRLREEKEKNFAEIENVKKALICEHNDDIQRREAVAKHAKYELEGKLAQKLDEINSMRAEFEKKREQYKKDLGEERMKNVAFEKAMMGKLDENSSEVFKAIAALVEKQTSRVELLERELAAHEARANRERDERLDKLRQEHKDDVQRINREWNDAMVLQATRHSENTTRLSTEAEGHLKRIEELGVETETLRSNVQELKNDYESLVAERDRVIGQLKVRVETLEIQKKSDAESFGKERVSFRGRIKCLEDNLKTERTHCNTALMDLRKALGKNEEAKDKMNEDANMLKFQIKQDHDRLVEHLTKTNSDLKEQLTQSQKLQRSESERVSKQVAALARELDKREQQVNALTKTVDDWRTKFEKAIQDHMEEEAGIRDEYGARIGTMSDEMTTLKEQTARDAERLSNLEKTKETLNNQIGKLTSVLDEKKQQAAKCAEKLRNLGKSNENLREQNEQFNGVLMAFNQRLDQLTSEHALGRHVMRLEHSALGNLMKPRLQTLEKIFQQSIQHLEANQDHVPEKSKTTWEACLGQFSAAFESFIEIAGGVTDIEDNTIVDIDRQNKFQVSSHLALVNGKIDCSDWETDNQRSAEGSQLTSLDEAVDRHSPAKRRRNENEWDGSRPGQ